MSDPLFVHLYGERVGLLTDAGGGKIAFSYTPEWHAQWTRGRAHPISLSLPVSAPDRILDATAYVAGLLPDSTHHRDLLAAELGIADDPTDFAFIRKVGEDSAGALTIMADPDWRPGTGRQEAVWLSEAELAEHLRLLPRRPLLLDEENGIMLSLAGVNDKAAVLWENGRAGLPRIGTPSTHIIKVDIPGLPDSVKTEHFCLRLAAAVGLRVPRTRLLTVEDQEFMLMSRYDRVISADGNIQRIHQEDFCQALNVMPAHKYERFGGPGWPQAFSLLQACANPAKSRDILLHTAAFQFLIGNPDAHAKNYSLMFNRSGAIRLAPLYDLNNAAAFRHLFKSVRPVMAMNIGTQRNPESVGPSDWEHFAAGVGMSQDSVMAAVHGMAENIWAALPAVVSGMPECEAIAIAAEDIRGRCAAWSQAPLRGPADIQALSL